jgi:hypothetical protein
MSDGVMCCARNGAWTSIDERTTLQRAWAPYPRRTRFGSRDSSDGSVRTASVRIDARHLAGRADDGTDDGHAMLSRARREHDVSEA